MSRLHQEIGGRMRALRKTLRLTQAQVAEAAGIETSFYGQIERGTNIPSLKTFLAVARALKTEPGDLLPSTKKRAKTGYDRVIEGLISDLDVKSKRLVVGMVSDLVDRLKK